MSCIMSFQTISNVARPHVVVLDKNYLETLSFEVQPIGHILQTLSLPMIISSDRWQMADLSSTSFQIVKPKIGLIRAEPPKIKRFSDVVHVHYNEDRNLSSLNVNIAICNGNMTVYLVQNTK